MIGGIMQSRTWLSRWKPTAVVLAGLLIAAACSSGDDASDGSGPAADEPAASDEPAADEPADEPAEEPAEEPADEPADEPTVVKIGYAYPDLAAFAVLNEEFGIGDPQLQAEAIVDMWRREGMLPENIDLQLVFAAYNILDTNAKLRRLHIDGRGRAGLRRRQRPPVHRRSRVPGDPVRAPGDRHGGSTELAVPARRPVAVHPATRPCPLLHRLRTVGDRPERHAG